MSHWAARWPREESHRNGGYWVTVSAMPLNRVRAVWTNFNGAPGYSNFYVSTTVTNITPIRTFFSTLINQLPAGLTITVPSSGDQINEANGAIVGGWTGTQSGAPVVGNVANTGPYAGGVGAVVEWKTSLLAGTRRVQGKTYIVPMISTGFAADGTLGNVAQTELRDSANALITAMAGELKIWTRPRPTIAGAGATVIAAVVPDLAAQMKSRRPS